MSFRTSIDDYVDDNNSCRAIDMYVDSLDTAKLKFANTRKVAVAIFASAIMFPVKVSVKKLLIAIKDGNIEQIIKDIQAYRQKI